MFKARVSKSLAELKKKMRNEFQLQDEFKWKCTPTHIVKTLKKTHKIRKSLKKYLGENRLFTKELQVDCSRGMSSNSSPIVKYLSSSFCLPDTSIHALKRAMNKRQKLLP